MKILMLSLVIVLCFNQKVMCYPLFDYITQHFHDIATSMSDTFNDIKIRITKMLSPTESKQLPTVSKLQIQGYPYMKRSFNDIDKRSASESETEIPEYVSLRAEPTALMSTPQLALLHGRSVESHVIHTRDGYLLTIHRLSPKLETKINNLTVILHHGLLGSSVDWILLGPKKSLPYMLADLGYDVWMANARGNYYSRGHIKLAVDSEEFWRFSFQEMGEYDLPSLIDYIHVVTKSKHPIDYIGHSMGATALLVLLTTMPTYNQHLRIGILMAPLVFMSNVEGPFKILTAMATRPPAQLLNVIGGKEFLPSRRVPKWFAVKYCKGPLLFCTNPLYFLSGGIPTDNHLWNFSFLARLLYHVPAGGSTDTILHYAQVIKSGKFHKFKNSNEQFPLSQVTLPIALISSSEDWLATIPDMLRLYFSIANPMDHYIIRGKNMCHSDFMWGIHAEEFVFKKIIEYLKNDLSDFTGTKANEIAIDFTMDQMIISNTTSTESLI